jgi:putative cell wall-binding protein
MAPSNFVRLNKENKMKLKNITMANQKFAIKGQVVEADASGVLDVSSDVAEVLLSGGWEAMEKPKAEPKVEAKADPKTEQKPKFMRNK